jgi:hypothetical protein
MQRIRVAQMGLGAVGCGILQTARQRAGLAVVGAIDVDPAKQGKDLSEVLGSGERTGILVQPSLKEVLARTGVDVVLHATGSHVPQVFPQLTEIVQAGVNVVSTCEELAYPFVRHPQLSTELDRLAKAHGVRILGTGVNPGFVMDTLVLASTAVCSNVRRVHVTRLVAARQRRLALQKKIGSGLSVAEFQSLVAKGQMGHVGLLESLHLVASGLGWKLAKAEESIVPVLADRWVETPHLTIAPGQVAGIHQVAYGTTGEQEIVLDLTMSMLEESGRDAIQIEATPPVQVEVVGGVHGDQATWSIVVNMVPWLLQAPPGLRTMQDITLPRASL